MTKIENRLLSTTHERAKRELASVLALYGIDNRIALHVAEKHVSTAVREVRDALSPLVR
jgi:hypothetical protein